MNAVAAHELTRNEAVALTSKIKARTEELWSLVKAAYDGKAWKSLGYRGWSDYARTEFNVSRGHAYRLIDQANVIAELKKVSPMGDISERQARALKPVIKEVTAEIKAKVEAGADPVRTTYAVIEARRVDAPSPSKQVEKPEPTDEEGPSLAELVDELQHENETLRAQLKAGEADDLRAEAVKWAGMYQNSKREQGHAMDAAAAAQDREKWVVKLLRRCGKAVGVADPNHTDPRDIAKAVETFARGRVAA